MAEWGRKEYSKKWPSRTHVWTWTAIFLTGVFFFGVFCLDYWHGWTAAERLYLTDYLKSGVRGKTSPTATAKYTLLEGVVGKSERLLIDDEIEPVTGTDGRRGYRLTDEGVKDGIARLQYVTGVYNDRALHSVMSHAVFQHDDIWGYMARPFYWSLAFFVVLLFVAIPKDRARRMVWKHGRRLRGPELVTTAEFNAKMGRPDGIAFVNEEQTWWDKIVHKNLSRWVRVPRDREAMHFLIVGDSGTGKSATIRQLLSQIADRGEAAIVYDPAMEYLPQFYNEQRGDVVLNPLDARCPFWSPGDEVPHEAEALTLAASLFPGKERDTESGLDYFGARYYASTMGRWMSPDWSAKADPLPYAKLNDPQSLNLYSYVGNNPLSNVDRDGHAPDILVIEDGPTQGNPIGHTSIAVTGNGVYSFGTNTPLGSSTTDFLKMESGRRDQTVTVIKTTPEQDQATVSALMKQDAKGSINVNPDNCSSRSNAALDAAGVPKASDLSNPITPISSLPSNIPGSAGERAQAVPGSQTTVIPKNSPSIPASLNQFNPSPGHTPKPENKKPNTGPSS